MDFELLKQKYDKLKEDGAQHYDALAKIVKDVEEGYKTSYEEFIDKAVNSGWSQENHNTDMQKMLKFIFKAVLVPTVEAMNKQVEEVRDEVMDSLNDRIKDLEEQIIETRILIKKAEKYGTAPKSATKAKTRSLV